MSTLRRWSFAWLLGCALAPAQTVLPVINLNDGGTGSLRAAFQSVLAGAPGSYVVEFRVPLGRIALNTNLQTLSANRAVTVRQTGTGGRLVLDARNVSPAGGAGLVFEGANSRLELPCTLQVAQGVGCIARASGIYVDDLEITGGSVQGFLADRAHGLTVRRLLVTGATAAPLLGQGILVINTTGASFATGSGGPPVAVRNCSAHGIVVGSSTGVTFGSVLCENNNVGILATNGTTNLAIGLATAPRSLVRNSALHGVQLSALANGGAPALRNIDVTDNGGLGIELLGGSGIQLRDLACDRNLLGALLVDGGATQIQVGPAVTTRGRTSQHSFGISVSHATDVALLGCQCGPDHTTGIAVGRAGSTGVPTRVSLTGCRSAGNEAGLSVAWASDVAFRDGTVENNVSNGLDLVGTAAQPTNVVTVTNTVVRNNGRYGVAARTIGGLVFGPGNRIDDNGFVGGRFDDCDGMQFAQNPSIARNRGNGIELTASSDCRFSSSTLDGNLGGMDVNASLRVVIQGCVIQNTLGIGLNLIGSAAQPTTDITVLDTTVRNGSDLGFVARTVRGLVFGPGNRVDDNGGLGCYIGDCDGMQFVQNPSIARNRSNGMEVFESTGCVIRGCAFQANQGISLWLVENSSGCVVGPGVSVTHAAGSGIIVESCSNTLLDACTVTDCTGDGISMLADARPQTGNRIRSCCVVRNLGIGIVQRGAPPTICEASTVAYNSRGVHAAQLWSGSPTQISVDSCIVWGNIYEDLSTTGVGGSVVPTNSFFRVPVPTGTNRAADPLLVNPIAGDFSVAAGSPARDAGNPALFFAAGALDARGQTRVRNLRVDCGGLEVQTGQGNAFLLTFAPATMPRGGGDIGFQVNYPATDVGRLSVLFLQLGPAGAGFPLFGAVVPLAMTNELLLLANDPRNSAALTVIPPSGLVDGTIRWAGRLPTSIANMTCSVCAVSLDPLPAITTVTPVATFLVQ